MTMEMYTVEMRSEQTRLIENCMSLLLSGCLFELLFDWNKDIYRDF